MGLKSIMLAFWEYIWAQQVPWFFFSEHNKYPDTQSEVPHGTEQRAIVRRSRERVHGVDLVVTRHPHDAKHLRRAVPSTRTTRHRGLLQASC